MRFRKALSASAAALAIVTLSALPASANAITGTKGCSAGHVVTITANVVGTTNVFVGPWSNSANIPQLTTRTWASNQRSGDWKVTSTGTVFRATAGCVNAA